MFNKLTNWIERKTKGNVDKEDIALGLVGGLAVGLVGGLAVGLVGGLAVGLVGGLVWGLVGGLVWGLVGGLAEGLVWGLGTLTGISAIAFFKYRILNIPLIPYIIISIIVVIAIAELFFLMEKNKPKKKENKISFTAKRKGINLLYSSFAVVVLGGFYNIVRLGIGKLIEKPEIVSQIACVLGWILLVIVGIGLIGLISYGYVYINSLKFKK